MIECHQMAERDGESKLSKREQFIRECPVGSLVVQIGSWEYAQTTEGEVYDDKSDYVNVVDIGGVPGAVDQWPIGKVGFVMNAENEKDIAEILGSVFY